MGGEVKTNVSDDFKSLEIEMGLRQEGNYIPYQGRYTGRCIDCV